MSAPREGDRGLFGSLYGHGFVRVAAAVPRVRVAEPGFNAERTLALARRASDARAAMVVFPELGLSAYTNEDLFHQDALIAAVGDALARIVADSAGLEPLIVVGAPRLAEQRLFNTAVVIHRGRVLGVVPKSYLPNYREFYEKRQFRAARDATRETISLLGETVPFGADLLFECRDLPGFVVHVELCEDLWVPIPPSSHAGLAGATVLANLSASNITVAKADYRRGLCASQSARTIAAYLYTAAGAGESTTDLAWDGHALIYENGDLLAESERFADGDTLVYADVDLDRLVQDRVRTTSFGDCARDHRERLEGMRRIGFDSGLAAAAVGLARSVERFPYVPADRARRNEHCEEVYSIQVQGLATRLRATGIENVVIGVSGGLDSTQALIVAARAIDLLGLPPGARRRHRRSQRAGARLVHLRRRRPDVPLRRQRLGAQDPDPVPGSLGDRHRAARARRRRGLAVGARHRDLARADPARRSRHIRPGAGQRERRRTVRAGGLLPLLPPSVRLPAEQGGVPRPPRLARLPPQRLARPDRSGPP
jgi:NAD+ synthase (glutamine-hydrolysing)